MTDIDRLNAWGTTSLPGLLGVEIVEAVHGRIVALLPVRPALLNPNGHLHGGTIVALADTCCGYGSMASLPEGAVSFTTVELKTNFLASAKDGVLRCEAVLVHGGRTTQIWDATVSNEASGKALALFRCTQLLIYPRP